MLCSGIEKACAGQAMGMRMTDDQMWRIAITGASTGIIALLIQQAKAKLRAERDRVGRTLIERLGYSLGRLWARTRRAYK